MTPLDVAKRAIDAIKKSEDQDPRMGIVTQFHEEEILEVRGQFVAYFDCLNI